MIPGCAQPQEEASEAGSRTESVEVRPVYRSRTYSNKDLVARRIRAVDLPHFHDVGRAVALPDRSLHRSLQRATRLPIQSRVHNCEEANAIKI